MIYNKSQVQKLNDKKILHRVGKHWTVVSIALLGLIGGASTITTNAQADTTQLNNQPKQQIKQNINNTDTKPSIQNITQQAKKLHTSVVARNALYTKFAQPSNTSNSSSSVATSKVNNTSKTNNFLPNTNKVSQKNSNITNYSAHSANFTNSSSKNNQDGINKLQNSSLSTNGFINPNNSSNNQSLNSNHTSTNNLTSTTIANNNQNVNSNNNDNQKLSVSNNKLNNIKKVNTNNQATKTIQVDTTDVGNAIDTDNKNKSSNTNGKEEIINPTQVKATGNINGLNYVSDGQGNINFIKGTANHQWNMNELSDAKSVTFNSDVNFSQVSDMSNAFDGLKNLKNVDMSNLNLKNVTNMTNLFESDSALSDIDLSGLNTNNLNKLQSAFKNDTNLKHVDLSGWNTTNVSDVGGMFSDDTQLSDLNLSGWNTSNFNNSDQSLGFLHSDNNLNNINLSNTDFSNLSQHLTSSDVPSWLTNAYETGSITPVNLLDGTQHQGIFTKGKNQTLPNSKALTLFFSDIYADDDNNGIAPVSVSVPENSNYYHIQSSDIPFGYALVNSDGQILHQNSHQEDIDDNSCHIKVAPIDNGLTYKYNANTKALRFMNGIANDWNNNNALLNINNINASDVQSISFSPNVDFSNVTDMSGMFDAMSSLRSADLRNLNTSNVSNMNDLFTGLTNLQDVNLNGIDTSNVSDMSSMFSGDKNLKSINLSQLDTNNVKNMSGMFQGDSNLQNVDLNNLDTHNVSDMSQMFQNDNALTNVNLSSLDTTNLKSMYNMFKSDYGIQKASLEGLDLRNINNMGDLFSSDNVLSDIDFSNTKFDLNSNPELSHILGSDANINTVNFTNTVLPQLMNKMHGNNSLRNEDFNLNGNDVNEINGDAPLWFSNAYIVGDNGLATSRNGVNLIDGNAHPGIWHPQSAVTLPTASTNSYATNSDISNINNSLNNLSGSVANNTTSNNSNSGAITLLSTSTNNVSSSANNSINIANNNITNNSKAITTLSNSANTRIDKNEANITSLSKAVVSLSGIDSTLNGSVKANSNNISNNLSAIGKLNNELNNDSQRLTNLIKTLHNDVNSKVDKSTLDNDINNVNHLLALKANEEDIVQDFNDLISATDSKNKNQNVNIIGKEANKFVDIMNGHLNDDIETLALSKADKRLVNNDYKTLNNDKASKKVINNEVNQEVKRLQNLIGQKGNVSDINNLYQNYNDLNNQLKHDEKNIKNTKKGKSPLIQKLRKSINQLNRYMKEENANQRTKLVKSGYLMPRQTMHLYNSLKGIGTNKYSIATIAPTGNNTMHILKAIHTNHGLRFLVNFNGQRAYATGNLGYVQNAYLDAGINYHGQKVFVKRPLLLHRHAHNETDNLGLIKPWKVLTINKVVNVSKYKHNRMTRIQLTNGKWITANKNFISLI